MIIYHQNSKLSFIFLNDAFSNKNNKNLHSFVQVFQTQNRYLYLVTGNQMNSPILKIYQVEKEGYIILTCQIKFKKENTMQCIDLDIRNKLIDIYLKLIIFKQII
ncbi:hypothetical protein ABPG72_005479 [Tetrahymena utriculariae]